MARTRQSKGVESETVDSTSAQETPTRSQSKKRRHSTLQASEIESIPEPTVTEEVPTTADDSTSTPASPSPSTPAPTSKRTKPSQPSPSTSPLPHPKRRLTWTPLMTHTLLRALVNSRHLRTETGFPRSVWDSVALTVLRNSDVSPPDRPLVTGPKCQGKIENLKRDYDLWKGYGLMDGFTANYETGLLTASDELWRDEIEKCPRLAALRKTGLPDAREMATVFDRLDPASIPHTLEWTADEPDTVIINGLPMRNLARIPGLNIPRTKAPAIDKEDARKSRAARQLEREREEEDRKREEDRQRELDRIAALKPTVPTPTGEQNTLTVLTNPLDREAMMRLNAPPTPPTNQIPNFQAQLQPIPLPPRQPVLQPPPQPLPPIAPRPAPSTTPLVPNVAGIPHIQHHPACLSPTGGQTIQRAVRRVLVMYKDWPPEAVVRAVEVMESEALACVFLALADASREGGREVVDGWVRGRIEARE